MLLNQHERIQILTLDFDVTLKIRQKDVTVKNSYSHYSPINSNNLGKKNPNQ